MRGRKPKPTAIKRAEGNPGKRPLNKREPLPVPGMPEAPEFLGAIALEEWGRIIAELQAARVMSAVDRGMIAGYCEAYEQVTIARARIEQDGAYVETMFGIKAHGAVNVLHKYLALMKSYLSEFGLSPSARTRVKTHDGDANPDQKAAQIIGF